MKKLFLLAAFFLVVGFDLALLGFQINIFAVSLISMGFLLLMAELHMPGFGILGIAGMFCLIMGTVFLIPTGPPSSASEQLSLNVWAVLSVPVFFGIFFSFALFKSYQIRMKEGIFKSLVGSEATAIDDISQKKGGYVKIQGEYWMANSNENIRTGDKVKILDKKGTVLTITKK